jgi:hypothetical protein
MRKRFTPTPEADSQTVLEIAREIENCNRVTPPSAVELAERQRRDREAERRRRERDRIAEEERVREAQERNRIEQEKAERERRAAQLRIAEEAKASMAERQRQQQAAEERRRLSQLHQEWASFKFQATQAQREQQRQAYFDDLQQTITNVTQLFSPPREPVEQSYVPPDEKSPRLGDPNWDPVEMGKAAIRWR